MAAYVKGRFHAARVGVTMAMLGLLAGLGIKSAGEKTTTVIADPVASSFLGNNTIGSSQIKQHSIRLGDIKLHEVASYKEFKLLKTQFVDYKRTAGTSFLKITDAAAKFLKIDDANIKFLKIDDAKASFLKIDDANVKFLKLDGIAQNALKIDGLGSDQLIQGHGQVITGSAALGGNNSDLFVLIGLLRVSAKTGVGGGGADVTLTNLSSTDTLDVNGDGQPQSIKPGSSIALSNMGDGSVRTLQVVIQGGTTAITIGLSSFTGGVHTLVGQAVVGSY